MARGDIIAIDLPAPAGPKGHEQVGHRPAIVVQTDITDSRLPTTMIVPLTSHLNAVRFPHTIYIDPSYQNGLSKPSVLLVFQLRAIDKTRLDMKIGQLELHYLQQLDIEMRSLLGL
ncbi:MAG: type II toxin-antitoxin system PemK/MazF family toxin [Candidatus Atribacteria bacterium]|nr:type II toxin-antitoxin system PemK/MazF family toxin [Candidatus Atribacteria bacterium]